MNSRSLRRLAADHGALHSNPLPPNYLFGPSAQNDSDLTSLDILLAGPTSTPYELGVFKLHLTIPATYPNEPPKAFFRTKIFHPNVDDNTGAVCVETLKRDWDSKLSLKDVLITISCLLVQPNASSALNADAGMLLEQGDGGWEAFEKRAKLMTKLHAGVPRDLKDAVRAAQRRGEESEESERKDSGTEAENKGAGRRKRKGTPLLREMSMETPVEMSKRRVETPPPPPLARPAPSRPFVLQSAVEDVFGSIRLPAPANHSTPDQGLDSSLLPYEQDDSMRMSPVMSRPPMFPSIAPQAPLITQDDFITSESSLEEEYPPSPKKSPQKQTSKPSPDYPASPRKSPQKHLNFSMPMNQSRPDLNRAESSRTAFERRLFITPVSSQQQTPAAVNPMLDSSIIDPNLSFDLGMDTEPDTELDVSFEIPKRNEHRRLASAVRNQRRRKPFPDPFSLAVPRLSKSVSTSRERAQTPLQAFTPQSLDTSVEVSELQVHDEASQVDVTEEQIEMEEQQRKKVRENEKLEKKLWRLCGGDVERWNRGDFGSHFEVRGARW